VIGEKTTRTRSEDVPDSASVLAQLDRILSTPLFQHSKRYPTFLRYVVEQTLRGVKDELKERTLGIAVFGRSPDYDTSADPVVRNTASEVRKRLEEYYSGPGHARELRISLPSGAYVPEFRQTIGQVFLPASAGRRAIAILTRSRRRRVLALAALLLAGLGLLGAIELSARKPADKLFWAPILRSPDSILVVTDTLVALRDKPQPDSGVGSRLVRDIIDPETFLNVSQESAKLASFLNANGKHIDYELARNVSLATLRTRPFILKGAFNNQWTRRAVAPFRFYFQLDRNPLVRRIVDRQDPERRDWAAPMVSGLTEDYALIARAVEPETGQMMLVIAGLSEKGSAAALEFVTNPKYLNRFASQAPAGWERRNIELVVKSDLVSDDWGEPRVVAMHFW
jgi:hypothetical protein